MGESLYIMCRSWRVRRKGDGGVGGWSGQDYVVTKNITIHQPTVGEIIDFGESRYFRLISTITATPSEYKAMLFDMGIDWENLTNYDMFMAFRSSLTPENSSILFGNLDVGAMETFVNDANEVALISKDGVVLDSYAYHNIEEYLLFAHNIKKKVDVAGNAFTKKMLIQLNRDDIEQQKNKPFESRLLPLASTLVNSPGFKYNSRQIRDIGIIEFMDSVYRLQIIRQADAILKGMCSGMVDTSKISPSSYDCFKDIHRGV